MGKLKLQMQISLDCVTTDRGGANFSWDSEVKSFVLANIDGVDRIILGRNTANGFVPHWASISAKPDDPDYEIGKRLTEIPKIVFSKTLAKSSWPNTELARGETVEEVQRLKKRAGGDLIVYGGSSFVSSLIKEGLIDQYYFLLNPVALINGETIFKSLKGKLVLTLLESRTFACGTVLLVYEPKS
ncbi:MAG TPA: dihydrofolate reductase family protein [Puia sp.]|jgi:dihydrofolate reductase